MNKKEIEQILEENPNFDLIWVASSQKNEQMLLNRLHKGTKELEKSFSSGDRTKYEEMRKKASFVRGIVMVGVANNRLTNAEQRESAFVIEKNVSAKAFDTFCNKLNEEYIGRIFC